jgi:chromosomal replication initiation ATPase DnaA
MTAGELWNTVKEQLRQEIPAANYDKWVKDAVGVDFEDNVLTVGARSESAKNWLEDRLDSTARRVITGIISRTVDVQFVIQ